MAGDCPFGRPKLWLSNHFAWELFQKVAGQVIVAGMGDIIGIRFESIGFLFDIYDIIDSEERKILFEKILLIDQIRIEMKNKELAEKNANIKKK